LVLSHFADRDPVILTERSEEGIFLPR